MKSLTFHRAGSKCQGQGNLEGKTKQKKQCLLARVPPESRAPRLGENVWRRRRENKEESVGVGHHPRMARSAKKQPKLGHGERGGANEVIVCRGKNWGSPCGLRTCGNSRPWAASGGAPPAATGRQYTSKTIANHEAAGEVGPDSRPVPSKLGSQYGRFFRGRGRPCIRCG